MPSQSTRSDFQTLRTDLDETLERLVELLARAAAEEVLQGPPTDAEAPDADA